MPDDSPTRDTEPPRAYHHGDLKRALVDAALALLRAEGPEALSLRAVARAAGVSPSAPYRHFADRRALVAAVAEEGFGRLGEALEGALRSGPAGPAFRDVAFAYVRFAHANPAEYRVMFGPEVARTEELPALRERSRAVLGGVAGAIAGLQQAGAIGPGDPMAMAVATWSMLHGVVTLSLDGQVDDMVPSLDALVGEVTRLMMFGMAPRPGGGV